MDASEKNSIFSLLCSFKYCQNCVTSNPVRSSRLGLVFDITRYFLHCRIPIENCNHWKLYRLCYPGWSMLMDLFGAIILGLCPKFLNPWVWAKVRFFAFILGIIFSNKKVQWYFPFQKYKAFAVKNPFWMNIWSWISS